MSFYMDTPKLTLITKKDSKDIKNLLPDELDSYWNKAKKAEKAR